MLFVLKTLGHSAVIRANMVLLIQFSVTHFSSFYLQLLLSQIKHSDLLEFELMRVDPT